MIPVLPPTLPAPAPVDWVAERAEWHLHVAADRVDVDATWHFRAVGGGPAERLLVGPGLLVTDAPAGAAPTPDGLVVELGPGLATDVHVHGTVAASGAVHLPILPTARTTVTVDAPGFDVTLPDALGGQLAWSDHLDAAWVPHVEAAPRALAPLVHAEVATAVWGAEGAVQAHAEVRWSVLRGERDTFRVRVDPLEELEVTGPALASWTREGDSLVLHTRRPVRGRFVVDVRGRVAAVAQVPAVVPDADRSERYVVLGRADEGELVPGAGPAAISRRALPGWAQGLCETVAVAAWHGDAAVPLTWLHTSALATPEVVITQATLEAVTNEDGRIFLRETLRVRNDRSQYLHVRPAPGYHPLGARVSGDPVVVLDDGAGGLYVPLERSVETVRGLVTFPVELLWAGEAGAYARRGERRFVAPAVDAPVQRVDWILHLPRDFRSPQVTTRVVTTTESTSVLNAMKAYRQNDFSGAQVWLDHAKANGESGEDADALQANLDVLNKKVDSDDAEARRVRDLARAKDARLEVAQAQAEADADRAAQAGDYEKADELYAIVEETAAQLDLTAQNESEEQADKKEEAQKKRAEVAEKRKVGASGKGGRGDAVAASEPPVDTPLVTEPPPNPAPEAPMAVADEVDLAGATETSSTRAPASVSTPMPVVAGVVARPPVQGAKRPARRGELDARPAPPPPPPPPTTNGPPPRSLEAHAAPMTLALPLDGPTVTGGQALLPPDTFPTLSVRYRGPR